MSRKRALHTISRAAGSDSEGEVFDLNAISSGTDSEEDHAPLATAKAHVSRTASRTKQASNPALSGPSRIYPPSERTFSAREAVDFLDKSPEQQHDLSSPLPQTAHVLTDHAHGIRSPQLGPSPSTSRRRARPRRFDGADHDQQEQKRRRTLSPIPSRVAMPMHEDFSEDDELLVPQHRPPASPERIREPRRRGAEEDEDLPLVNGNYELGDDGQALDLLDRMSTLSVSSPAPSPPPILKRTTKAGHPLEDTIEISD